MQTSPTKISSSLCRHSTALCQAALATSRLFTWTARKSLPKVSNVCARPCQIAKLNCELPKSRRFALPLLGLLRHSEQQLGQARIGAGVDDHHEHAVAGFGRTGDEHTTEFWIFGFRG